MAKKSVLDALLAKENKAAYNDSRSSTSVPPPQKIRRLVHVVIDSSQFGDGKNAIGSTTSDNQVEGHQDDEATFSPTPPVIQPIGVHKIEGFKKIGTTKSLPNAETAEVGEFDHLADMPVALFSPRPYISPR